MKYAVVALFAVVSLSVLADGFVSGTSSYYKGDKSPAQLTITGSPAQKIFESLEKAKAPGGDIIDEHGGMAYGSYRNGADVACDVTYGNYSCTIFLDEAGSIAHKSK